MKRRLSKGGAARRLSGSVRRLSGAARRSIDPPLPETSTESSLSPIHSNADEMSSPAVQRKRSKFSRLSRPAARRVAPGSEHEQEKPQQTTTSTSNTFEKQNRGQLRTMLLEKSTKTPSTGK